MVIGDVDPGEVRPAFGGGQGGAAQEQLMRGLASDRDSRRGPLGAVQVEAQDRVNAHGKTVPGGAKTTTALG